MNSDFILIILQNNKSKFIVLTTDIFGGFIFQSMNEKGKAFLVCIFFKINKFPFLEKFALTSKFSLSNRYNVVSDGNQFYYSIIFKEIINFNIFHDFLIKEY